ncbi:MAG: 50S ribosomal protein L24 [Minisyncoccia bacterium]
MKIKSNDKVKILAGKDKGKSGKVSKVIPSDNKVVVEGVNIIKKHVKGKRSGEKGQIVTFPGAINASNVMLICPKCNKEARIGYLVLDNGDKHRICGKCKQTIETKIEK